MFQPVIVWKNSVFARIFFTEESSVGDHFTVILNVKTTKIEVVSRSADTRGGHLAHGLKGYTPKWHG